MNAFRYLVEEWDPETTQWKRMSGGEGRPEQIAIMLSACARAVGGDVPVHRSLEADTKNFVWKQTPEGERLVYQPEAPGDKAMTALEESSRLLGRLNEEPLPDPLNYMRGRGA